MLTAERLGRGLRTRSLAPTTIRWRPRRPWRTVASAVVLVSLLGLTWWVARSPVTGLDLRAFGAIWRRDRLVADVGPAATALTALLQPAVTLGLLVVVSAVRAWREQWLVPLLYAGSVAGGGGVVVLLLAAATARVDPAGLDPSLGGSFPSGHTFAAIAGLGGVLVLALPRVRWWMWALVAAAGGAVGGSMLVLSLHWFTDVVGGALVAALALLLLGWPSERRLSGDT